MPLVEPSFDLVLYFARILPRMVVRIPAVRLTHLEDLGSKFQGLRLTHAGVCQEKRLYSLYY